MGFCSLQAVPFSVSICALRMLKVKEFSMLHECKLCSTSYSVLFHCSMPAV
jgi:hypothetical protein